jgi:hypothetical protein
LARYASKVVTIHITSYILPPVDSNRGEPKSRGKGGKIPEGRR